MNRLHPCLLAVGLATSFIAGNSQAQLEINLNFTNFNSGPSGDVNTILNGASLAEARSVIEYAAAIWEDAFAESSSGLAWASSGVLTQDIAVGWSDHAGNTLATGGTGWYSSSNPAFDNMWSGGSLNWDGDADSIFYVDTTPNDSTEWSNYVESDLNLNGTDVNVQKLSYGGVSNNDMLTVAIHEIGHALGFLNGYPLYDDADLGGDSDIDITSGDFNGVQIDIDGGHTDLSIATPFSDPTTYNPTVMASSLFTGTRYGLTEADILIVAEYLDFDMSTVNFNPVPEPSALAVLLVGGLMASRRRRRD